ncbi:MAG TPA: hypothetical protein P5260_11660 [Candidatus Competibacter sp.]|nr:hypothetical protein [Candidatus Competibacter sp.]
MNHWNGYWVIPLALFTAPTLAANKCIEASGRIFYQAAPCPANTHGGDMSLNVNRPFTGQAQPPATINSSPITTDTATAPPDHSTQEDGERSPPKNTEP